MSAEELKQEIIEIIKDDLLSNVGGEYDIVKNCANDLIKLCNSKTPLKDTINLLESYSYGVIDLLEVQRNLEDIKQYFISKKYNGLEFTVINNLINEEINKNE